MESLEVREPCQPCTYAASVILAAGFAMVVFSRVPVGLAIAPTVVLACGAVGAFIRALIVRCRDWHVAGWFLLAGAVSYAIAGCHLPGAQ